MLAIASHGNTYTLCFASFKTFQSYLNFESRPCLLYVVQVSSYRMQIILDELCGPCGTGEDS
jgi:hypothetical protein